MREYSKGITKNILRILSVNKGVTIHTIMDNLADLDIYPLDATLKSVVSQLKSRGLVDHFEKSRCDCCGRFKREIFITPAGRQKLNAELSKSDLMAMNVASDKYLKTQEICNT